MFDQPIILLDVETTGANPAYDRITEIGLVEADAGRPTGEWSTLVNPGVSIPPAIQALTGITNEMVALAPTFAEVSEELHRRLEGKLLVAHNARFDYGFLRNEFRRAGVRYSAKLLCTVKLSRKLFPQHVRHNLDSLIARHGVVCSARHRALGDARVLWELLREWRAEIGAETLREAATALLRTPSAPPGLPDLSFDDIPEAPGVYLFYGENDLPLYVGKSVNLRSRVMAHFASDHRETKEMRIAQQVRRVEWIETAGELGALIQEARLVKLLAPLHNRRLRREAELCSFHWRPERPGAPPQLVSAREIDSTQFDSLYGLFRSRRAALEALREIAQAHGLCLILTGLEKGRGPCFAHQLKRCRGACVGKESAAAHAVRLMRAFSGLRMQAWPFRGRIGVRETDASGGRSEVHVLDRWCYLGTARSEEELREINSGAKPVFDLDTYRVLARFLKRSHGAVSVVDLAA